MNLEDAGFQILLAVFEHWALLALLLEVLLKCYSMPSERIDIGRDRCQRHLLVLANTNEWRINPRWMQRCSNASEGKMRIKWNRMQWNGITTPVSTFIQQWQKSGVFALIIHPQIGG